MAILVISMEAEWFQFPLATQDSINSLTTTQGSIGLLLPDPKRSERLSYRWGIWETGLPRWDKGGQSILQFPAWPQSWWSSAGRWGVGQWLASPHSGWSHLLWRRLWGYPQEVKFLSYLTDIKYFLSYIFNKKIQLGVLVPGWLWLSGWHLNLPRGQKP